MKTIAVDLDGTLAEYHGWQGPTVIGDPVGGASGFLTELAKLGRVVIFSTRCNTQEGRDAVHGWLKKHGLHFDAIHEGPGKPKASAYVDDRAVRVPRNSDCEAFFQAALSEVSGLVGETSSDVGSDTPTLVMTLGLPQSGKSTWARATGHPVVNPDAIRKALHGQPFIKLAEPFVWAIAKVMVRALFLAGHRIVVLDATNTTRKRRDDWKSSDWDRAFVRIGGPEMRTTCINRAETTAENEKHLQGLVGAINRMADNWEPITADELSD